MFGEKNMQPGEEKHIFERGCLRAGEEWIESNLVPVAAVKVGIMILQVPTKYRSTNLLCARLLHLNNFASASKLSTTKAYFNQFQTLKHQTQAIFFLILHVVCLVAFHIFL